MPNIIDSIQLSGVTYTIGGGGGGTGGTEVEEMTQAEYDAASSAGTLDAETLYIITDAPEINANEYVTKASNVSSGLTVRFEQTSPWEYIKNSSEFYLSADTNCSYAEVYYSLKNYGCCWYPLFDFSTIPTFEQDFISCEYDSTTRTYHVWSTNSSYIFEDITVTGYDDSGTFKLWIYTWQIPSGQTATFLNNALPPIVDAIDDAKQALNTISINNNGSKTQWSYGGYRLDGTYYGNYGITVCDGKEIVNDNGLKLGDISTQQIYGEELLKEYDCTQTPFGDNWQQDYSQAVNHFIMYFNTNLNSTEYQTNFYYYYYSDGSLFSNELYVGIRNNNGTFEVNYNYGEWTSDYASITSTIQTESNLDITVTSTGIEYEKESGGTRWLSHIFVNSCLYNNDNESSLYSGITVYDNSIGIYDAVETLFGNYEDGKYVETSAITSSVTSGSTDVLTSGGAYEQFGGLKIVKLTESQYTALVTKDESTLYVVIPDPNP